MYYHIRVTLKTSDSTELDTFIQQVKQKAKNQGKLNLIKKIEYNKTTDWLTKQQTLIAEAWLDLTLSQEKLDIFNKFKTFVSNKGGYVEWHECQGDEENPQPCVISEEFEG